MTDETKPKKTRAPGGGRKAIPADARKSNVLQVCLTKDVMAFVTRQGGSEWVRSLIEKLEIDSRIL